MDLSSRNLTYDLTNFYSSGVISIAPEPGRMSLLMLGLMMLTLRRRRRA